MTTTLPGYGFEHELVLHDGPAELLDLMVPFLQDGAAAGEGVVVVGEPDFVAAVRSATADLPTLQAFAQPAADRFPARDLHRFDRMLTDLESTVPRVRVANQMPRMTAARWPEWRRYEAAANTVLAGHSVWGTCAYDTRHLTPGMLTDLRATHAVVRTADERHGSADFADLDARTRSYLDVPPHPVGSATPTLLLTDPTPAAARAAVRRLAIGGGLSATAQESVILATSETVANASIHGGAPVVLRGWASGTGRVTIAVSDSGTGPPPLVGLLPGAPGSSSGRGMWILHLLVSDVHHRTSSDGYTITFTVDADPALAAGTGPEKG